MSIARRKLIALAGAAGMFAALPAFAQEWAPSHDMTMIVASSPGTPYDVLSRAMEQLWPKYFGVNLIVQNMSGAGGRLGLDHIVNAEPDGHKLGFLAQSVFLSEAIEPSFPWKTDEVPILLAATTPPYVVVTGANSGFSTWEDVRKAERRIAVAATSGMAQDVPYIKDLLDHGAEVTAAMLGSTAATRMAIEAGDADLWSSVASLSIMGPIAEGRLKPLFLYGEERMADLPDVPTHIELGMPEKWSAVHSMRVWVAPIGIDPSIAASLEARMRRLLSDSQIAGWAKENGLVDGLVDGATARTMSDTWRDIVLEHIDIYKEYGG